VKTVKVLVSLHDRSIDHFCFQTFSTVVFMKPNLIKLHNYTKLRSGVESGPKAANFINLIVTQAVVAQSERKEICI